jgi:predicted Zn-dependent protease with MMP-like domain
VAAVGRLEGRWGEELEQVDVAVEDVPPSDPATWEGGAVPLARVFPADGGERARLVVYRRPVEQRAEDDLDDLVRQVVVEQVAELLGRSPDEVDPGYDPG